LGISSLLDQPSMAYRILGSFLVTCSVAVVLLFAVWWEYHNGRAMCLSHLKRQQRRADALRDLSDDMEYVREYIEVLEHYTGLGGDDDDDDSSSYSSSFYSSSDSDDSESCSNDSQVNEVDKLALMEKGRRSVVPSGILVSFNEGEDNDAIDHKHAHPIHHVLPVPNRPSFPPATSSFIRVENYPPTEPSTEPTPPFDASTANFTSGVQQTLLRLSSKYGAKINEACESHPTKSPHDPTLKYRHHAIQEVKANKEAIDVDMCALHHQLVNTKQEGTRRTNSRRVIGSMAPVNNSRFFSGYRALGNDTYLDLMEDLFDSSSQSSSDSERSMSSWKRRQRQHQQWKVIRATKTRGAFVAPRRPNNVGQ